MFDTGSYNNRYADQTQSASTENVACNINYVACTNVIFLNRNVFTVLTLYLYFSVFICA